MIASNRAQVWSEQMSDVPISTHDHVEVALHRGHVPLAVPSHHPEEEQLGL